MKDFIVPIFALIILGGMLYQIHTRYVADSKLADVCKEFATKDTIVITNNGHCYVTNLTQVK